MNHDEYEALVEEIRGHMRHYYDEDAPVISDYEYDRLMLRLKEAEREHPAWITPDSPTQIVGASATGIRDGAAQHSPLLEERVPPKGAGEVFLRTAGVTVTHDVPMLSIQDVFSKEEVLDWVSSVRAMHPDAVFCVEEKIDGLSMSLRYDHGRLTLAETRGDGFTGEDVTLNAKEVAGVVQTLDVGATSLEIRGEVYMTHEAFAHTNALQEARGKKTFANPRNCAAGTLRILDPKVTKERGLSFYVFNVQRVSDDAKDALMTSHDEGLTLLAKCGVQVAPRIRCKTDEEIVKAIDAIGARRGDLSYDIDGAVVKIDRIAYREDFPAGSKYSAGHIAYKYPPEEKEATITDIELSVGMTGRINPTAVFTPVQLCGTTVSRATLHNQDFIDKLGIGIGKRVLVYKSGEIIPKIRKVVTPHPALSAPPFHQGEGGAIAIHESNMDEYRKENGIFAIPGTCPVCGGVVQRGRSATESDSISLPLEGAESPGETRRERFGALGATATRQVSAQPTGEVSTDAADLYCINDGCPAKLTRRIINFVSRDAMDIKGFGAEYVTTLIEEGYIRNIDDLYTLKQHRDELIEKGLIGKEKNTDKLLKVIEDSKDNEPWRLLAGFAIANVGRTSARTLMRHFASIDALAEATVDELTEVEDIGDITAQAIHGWFADPAHRDMLSRLKELGVRMEKNTPHPSVPQALTGEGLATAALEVSDALTNRTYVVTGDLIHFKNRDALIDFIEARGGKVAGSVSKKTYALINNDAASTSGKNKKAQELGIPILTEDAFLASLNTEAT